MAAAPYNPTGEYQPKSTIGLPPLYAWPPRPVAAMKQFELDWIASTNYPSLFNA
jgi:hypothetical protein